MLLPEGPESEVDSCSLPPILKTSLSSNFSTNWGWSPDLNPGLATLGQSLATADQPTQLAPQCKDPPVAELTTQAAAVQGERCNCWQQIKPSIPSLLPF